MQNKGISTRVSHTQSPDKQNRWLWPAIILAAAILLALLLAGSTSNPPPVPPSAGHGLQKSILKAANHPLAPDMMDGNFVTLEDIIMQLLSVGIQVTVLPVINGFIKLGLYGSWYDNYSSLGSRLVGFIKNGFHRLGHILPAEFAIAQCLALLTFTIQFSNPFNDQGGFMAFYQICCLGFILITWLPLAVFLVFSLNIDYLIISERTGFFQALKQVILKFMDNPYAILSVGAETAFIMILTLPIVAVAQFPVVILHRLWNIIYPAVIDGKLSGYIPQNVPMMVSGLFAGMYLLIQIAANLYMSHLMFKQHRVSAPAHTGAHLD